MAKNSDVTQAAPISVPTPLSVGPVAPAPNGVRVAAPAGMESISVGGMNFARDGDGFVLPAPLVAAAAQHIKSFEDATARAARAAEAEAARLLAEADLPGRLRRLEERLAAVEASLGIGASRG